MKKVMILAISICCLHCVGNAQWPAGIKIIDMGESDTASIQGDLATGKPIKDLSWAWNSANACFPGTQAAKFMGNHVFFAVTMPPRCEMFITVTPEDGKGDLSIYAYRIGATEYNLVPNLGSCITCEADHKWDGNWKGKVQTSERKVSFQNPGTESYNILIGVSAPKGITAGTFKVNIKLVQ
jgi:hypothetical protein